MVLLLWIVSRCPWAISFIVKIFPLESSWYSAAFIVIWLFYRCNSFIYLLIFLSQKFYLFSINYCFSTGVPLSYFSKIPYSNLYFQLHLIAEILFSVDVLFFLFSSLTNLIASLSFSFDRNLSPGTRITSSELKILVYFYQVTSTLTKRVYTMVFKVELVINDGSPD